MNKIVSLVFMLLLSLQLFAQQVHEEVISTGDTLIFSCSADTATLTGTGLIRSSDVVIPSVVEHDGQQYTVTALGVCCFNHAVAMSHLTIPNTVRTIKLAALGGLMKIGTVKIPDSVRYIAELAFGDVPNVEYHGNASGAPWGAWYINAYKERDLYFADSTKEVLVCAEKRVKHYKIPSSVKKVERFAFVRTNLEEVVLDDASVEYGYGAFSECKNLKTVYYNLPNCSANNLFSECSALDSVTLGDDVRSMPSRIFMSCSSIRHIRIPDQIRVIGTENFMNCTGLISLRLGENVHKINIGAFDNCSSLSDVYMNKKLDSICFDAFRNSGIRHIELPARMKLIFGGVFEGCSQLESISSLAVVPPVLDPFAFSEQHYNIPVRVPCDLTGVYASKWTYFRFFDDYPYVIVARSSDISKGTARVTVTPTCSSPRGEVQAVPASGCKFVQWDNGSTDNPFVITSTPNSRMYQLTAIFADKSDNDIVFVKVYGSHGRIVVEAPEEEDIHVYDILGRTLYSGHVAQNVRIAVPVTGIYYVRLKSGLVRKVFVPVMG